MKYETIIGLEIHVQLKTRSKMFCSCPNEFGDLEPNTLICPICLGHPGVLPVANEQAIQYAVRAALALNLHVNEWSKFDRKSYFYPDLPKGYQISQYDKPLAEEGYVEIVLVDGVKKFGIERLHIEEDAAKNFHGKDSSLVDFNRSGTPLVEIVTRPDFRSPLDAKAFLQELRLTMRYLGISDAEMEKGQRRCDANISLRPEGDATYYPKTEIKNLNSFRAVERALTYEVGRQTKLWEKGKAPDVQSTRGWNEDKGETVEQRTKEEASDYRYFPEPDLPPIVLSAEEIKTIKQEIPELPNEKRTRLLAQYGLPLGAVNVLVDNPALAAYAEKVISELLAWLEASDNVSGTSEEIWEEHGHRISKLVTNWLINNLLQLMNSAGTAVSELKITPENFAEFLKLVFERTVNSTAAQTILSEMFASGTDPSVILEEQDLGNVSGGEEIAQWIGEVVQEYPEQVKEFQAGKDPVLKYLIGMVMKKSKGKADPVEVEKLLRETL